MREFLVDPVCELTSRAVQRGISQPHRGAIRPQIIGMPDGMGRVTAPVFRLELSSRPTGSPRKTTTTLSFAVWGSRHHASVPRLPNSSARQPYPLSMVPDALGDAGCRLHPHAKWMRRECV
jgi:hypothetical protein